MTDAFETFSLMNQVFEGFVLMQLKFLRYNAMNA